MAKVLVFDLGGTLMEYKGMPDSWIDYYKQGFETINSYYHCGVSEACMFVHFFSRTGIDCRTL